MLIYDDFLEVDKIHLTLLTPASTCDCWATALGSRVSILYSDQSTSEMTGVATERLLGAIAL